MCMEYNQNNWRNYRDIICSKTEMDFDIIIACILASAVYLKRHKRKQIETFVTIKPTICVD
jgi:hypothetical protein